MSRKAKAPDPSTLTPEQRAAPLSVGAFTKFCTELGGMVRDAINRATDPLAERATSLESRLARTEARLAELEGAVSKGKRGAR